MKPVWASAQWFEVRYRRHDLERRVDGRRRTKATAEKLAAELRKVDGFQEVWVVEVNRLRRPMILA